MKSHSFLIVCIMLFSQNLCFATTNSDVNESDSIFNGWTEEDFVRYNDSIINALYKPVYSKSIPIDSTEYIDNAAPYTDNISIASETALPTAVSIDKSLAVGKIEIKSGKSQTGSKTYEVPIQVLPGYGGFQPTLSLNYDSHQGSSLYGYGWSLSGISMISRTSKNLYYDNKVQGITLDNDDALVLDGMRLIETGVYNSYKTFVTNYGRIKVIGFFNSDKVYKYFNVYYPDGRTATFGNPWGTHDRQYFPIKSIKDVHGSEIVFNYLTESNNFIPTTITYNGNCSINFEYSTRENPIVKYIGGLKTTELKILKSISVKKGNLLIRKYSFSYMESNNQSLLKEITCEGNNGKSLNPITFYYNTDLSINSFDTSTTQLLSWYESSNPNMIKAIRGKLDYASKADGLISLPNQNPYFKYYLSGNTFKFNNLYSDDEKIYLYAGLKETLADPMPNLVTGPGFIDILCADIVGKQDEYVIKINDSVVSNLDRVTFSVYRANPYAGLAKLYERSFSFNTVDTDIRGYTSIQPKYYYSGDFDGDGRMEILAVGAHRPFGASSQDSKCYLFDLENNSLLYSGHIFDYIVDFVGTKQSDAAAAANNTDKLFVFDYDGDGKTDICHINDSGINIYTFEVANTAFTPKKVYTDNSLKKSDLKDCDILLSDCNGDGLIDILVTPPNTNSSTLWSIYNSKGNGSFEKTTFQGQRNSSSYLDGFLMQDVNGDGLSDLIKYTANTFETYLAKPNSFATNPVKVTYSKGNSILVPLDINTRNCFTQLVCLKDGIVTKYSFSRDVSAENLIAGMSDSFGVVEHNQYSTIDEVGEANGFYSRAYNAVFPYVNVCEPMWVLSGEEIYVDDVKKDSKTYEYYNAVIHRQGLGFCGFERIDEYDRHQRKSSHTYLPYQYGLPSKEETPFVTKSFEYNNIIPGDGTLRIRVSKATEYDAARNMTKTTSYSYDDYDNPTRESVHFSDNIDIVKNKTYSNNDTISGYYLGFLTKEVTTTTRDESTLEETMEITDFKALQPLAMKRLKNGNVLETNTYTYTDGLVTKISKIPYSSDFEEITQYTYDDYGRQTSKIDFTGETESYEYDKYGNLSVKTDFTGSTKYSYDGFNRISSIENPDSTESTFYYSWGNMYYPVTYLLMESNPGKPFTSTGYDAFGRKIYNDKKLFGDSYQKISTVYDDDGNIEKISEPYAKNPYRWTVYSYDSFNRLTEITDFTGKKTTHQYNTASDGYTIITTDKGVEVSKTYDSQGLVKSVEDATGVINIYRNADGEPREVNSTEDLTTTFEYDDFGRKTKISDPTSGSAEFTYDSNGDLVSEQNGTGEVTQYTYDQYHRLKSKNTTGLIVNYDYDSHGQLISETCNNGYQKNYAYDAHGRKILEQENFTNGIVYTQSFSYADGNINKIKYTSTTGVDVTERRNYNYGYLSDIIINETDTIYSLKQMNIFGFASAVKTGDYTRHYSTDSNGYVVQRYYSGSYVPHTTYYNYDSKTGNMTRYGSDTFSYDNMNRLTKFGSKTISYNKWGTPSSISDVGTIHTDNQDRISQVTGVSLTEDAIPTHSQEISYYPFSRVKSIKENGYEATFKYKGDYSRESMTITKDDKEVLTRYYGGDNFTHEISTKFTRSLLFVGGDYYHAPAVFAYSSGSPQLLYLVRDNLGTIIEATTRNGMSLFRQSFDAWGRHRDPETLEVYNYENEPEFALLDRGYSGHEHLPWFGLINMNARLYDPAIAQFISPDPYIQDIENSQNHNRYSYALNNPLMYRDENGEFFMTIFTAFTDLVGNLFKHGFHTSRYNWKRTENAWKIETSVFKGNVLQILGKLTWGLGNTLIGHTTASTLNLFGQIDEVTELDGMLALSSVTSGGKAFTIGHYSFGPDNYRATWEDHLFVHEYGHYIQSQALGSLYRSIIGVPSLISAASSDENSTVKHHERWFEVSASRLGAKHFDKKYGSGAPGYNNRYQNKTEKNYFDKNSFETGSRSLYTNPRTGEVNNSKHPTSGSKIVFLDYFIFL